MCRDVCVRAGMQRCCCRVPETQWLGWERSTIKSGAGLQDEAKQSSTREETLGTVADQCSSLTEPSREMRVTCCVVS